MDIRNYTEFTIEQLCEMPCLKTIRSGHNTFTRIYKHPTDEDHIITVFTERERDECILRDEERTTWSKELAEDDNVIYIN